MKQQIDHGADAAHFESIEDRRNALLLAANRNFKKEMIAALEEAIPYIKRFGTRTRLARRLDRHADQLLDHMKRYRFSAETPTARKMAVKHIEWAMEKASRLPMLYRQVRSEYIARFKGNEKATPDIPKVMALPNIDSSTVAPSRGAEIMMDAIEASGLRISDFEPPQTRRSKQGQGYKETRPASRDQGRKRRPASVK